MIEILKQRMSAALGLHLDEVSLVLRLPLTYQSNRLYDLRAGGIHWIVKEFCRPDEFPMAPRREYQSLELLERLDIAPRPVFLQAEPQPPLGPLVVYEYMPGQMWDRRRPAAAELRQLAGIWLKMGELPAGDLLPARTYEGALDQAAAGWQRDFARYVDWAGAHYPAALPAARLCQGALLAHGDTIHELSRGRRRLAFSRSDSRFANIIARPDGRLGMVDWEDSGLTDPALSVADLIVHANQEDLLSTEEWQAFLAPYLAACRVADPGLERRLEQYVVVLSLFWLSILLSYGVARAQDGRLNGWSINEMAANQRLRRYLGRVLVRPGGDFCGQMDGLADLVFFPTSEGEHDRNRSARCVG